MDKRKRDILNAKYDGARIGKLNESELIIAANAVLFKISVITGWVIPDSKLYQESLIAEFVNKLKEDYQDLTVMEILYAMRNHSRSVEDYGKAMNLHLIDKVVDNYRSARTEVSMLEETQTVKEQRIFSEEELDDYARETAQIAYARFLQGHELVNPEANREIMVKDDYIKRGDSVISYFEFAKSKGWEQIYIQKPTNEEK